MAFEILCPVSSARRPLLAAPTRHFSGVGRFVANVRCNDRWAALSPRLRCLDENEDTR